MCLLLLFDCIIFRFVDAVAAFLWYWLAGATAVATITATHSVYIMFCSVLLFDFIVFDLFAFAY